MVLSMSRPHRDPKTGTFYLRVRVPQDIHDRAKGQRVALPVGDTLRTVRIGDTVKVTLQTKDCAEAKRRYAQALEALQAHWETVRRGPRKLTHKETVALAGELYRTWTAAIEDDPGSPRLWEHIRDIDLAALRGEYGKGQLLLRQESRVAAALEERFGPFADHWLRAKGLLVDDASRRRLLIQIGLAMSEAADRLRKNAAGDYSPDPALEKRPRWEPPTVPLSTSSKGSLTFDQLLARWKAATSPRQDTIEQWGRVFSGSLRGFIGHNDAGKVQKADVVRWRDHLLTERNLAPKVVRDTYIAAVKAIYNVSVSDDLLPTNPADGVKVHVPKKILERDRGFTEAEAIRILKHAKVDKRGRLFPKTQAAIRWVPWICAFTGARVTEITQLRKEDVHREGDMYVLRITPEAGSVKNSAYRDVPVHPQLVEEGFIEFVDQSDSGPLFYAPGKGTPRSRAKSLGAKLGKWVRDSVGITDKRVQPNHGWRHRFNTIARDAGIDYEKREFIVGRTLPGVGGRYGDMRGLYAEIRKLPWVAA